MNTEIVVLIVQVIAAIGVILSVFYLAIQVNHQLSITKAQFGFALSQRLYDRFFKTATDPEFCNLLSKDWSNTEFNDGERWQVGFHINCLLIDLFDTYDKVIANFVSEDQLNIRMNLLKSGLMKIEQGKMLWNLWKTTRSDEFISWFESEIYGGEDINSFDLKSTERASSMFR